MEPPVFVDGLTGSVCRSLLASHDVGRLAFLGDDGYPVIFPVNYSVVGEDVIIQTNRGEAFEHAPLQRVAFEVDRFDESARTGWSVLVRGEARVISGEGRSTPSNGSATPTGGDEPGSQAWAPGDKHQWLAIGIGRISGRQIVRPTN